MVTIHDLPLGVMIQIFKQLSSDEVSEHCFWTCKCWNNIVTEHFMQPHLLRLAHKNEDMNFVLCENGWTEDCTNYKIISPLYHKFKSYKIVISTGFPYQNGQKTEIVDLISPLDLRVGKNREIISSFMFSYRVTTVVLKLF